MTLIWIIIIGGLIGWIASMMMSEDVRMGLLENICCGIVGSWLGGYLFGIGTPVASGFSLLGFLASLIGACIVIWLYFVIKDRRSN